MFTSMYLNIDSFDNYVMSISNIHIGPCSRLIHRIISDLICMIGIHFNLVKHSSIVMHEH